MDTFSGIGSKWTMEFVERSNAAKGFVVLPRRWVVERTLAWQNRDRHFAKDFEQTHRVALHRLRSTLRGQHRKAMTLRRIILNKTLNDNDDNDDNEVGVYTILC